MQRGHFVPTPPATVVRRQGRFEIDRGLWLHWPSCFRGRARPAAFASVAHIFCCRSALLLSPGPALCWCDRLCRAGFCAFRNCSLSVRLQPESFVVPRQGRFQAFAPTLPRWYRADGLLGGSANENLRLVSPRVC